MEIYDRDTIVYNALRILRNDVFAHFRPMLQAEFGVAFDDEVKLLFKKEWAQIERSAAIARGTAALARTPKDALDHLSINHCATLVDKWSEILLPGTALPPEVMKKRKAEVIRHLHELNGVRNPVAHPPEEPISRQDAMRAVDTARRVAELIEIRVAEELNEIWEELHQTGREDRAASLMVDELPSRETITNEFVGREPHLEQLFRWLSDPDRGIWVLAGDGGKGKTTVAYEFATQARSEIGDLGFHGILWMSAKKRKFVEGALVPTASADFVDLDSAIGHILDCIGVGSDSTLPTKVGRKICRELLDETPLLIIADDIDSLENTEEEAIEFLNYDIPRTSSKVLITSRRKLLGLGACTTMVEGLSEAESEIFVVKRAASLGLDAGQFTAARFREIHNITDGSPLYIEDLLRFAQFYSLKRAINDWSGQSGDAAREYSMERELEKLSEHASLCLGVLSFASAPISLEECAVIADLPTRDAMDALDELARWNLATRPGLIEEHPRYVCSRNLAKLVKKALASDQELKIKNGLKAVQEGVAVSGNRVKSWNQQAVALQKSGQQDTAESTLLAGLTNVPNSPELYSQLGWLYSKWTPAVRVADAREAFYKARTLGARSRDLYGHWAEMELLKGEFQKAVELCEEGVLKGASLDPFVWRLGARAHIRLGQARERSLMPDSAKKEFARAREMLEKAEAFGRSIPDKSKTFKIRLELATARRDEGARRRIVEEWADALPDDPFRAS